MLGFVQRAAKACFAASVAALSGLATVLVGDAGFDDLTAAQWVTIALATLLAFGGTYGLANRPAVPKA